MPRLCPDCRLPEATECICEDEPVNFPPGSGALIVKALGGGEPDPGPPYTHVLQPPPYPEEGEPYEPPPPPYTIEREPDG